MATTVRFEPSSSPTASVLMLAWREGPLLMECLRSLEASVRRVPYEVILVLNEPTRELLTSVERSVSGIQLIRTRVNVGYGGAMNLAAARAKGRYLVLLNDDTEVLPGWLEQLVDTAERRPEAGAVGGTTLFPDGTLQEAGCVVWADGSTVKVGRNLEAGGRRYDYERLVDFCSGSSLLVRRSSWEHAGGMDDEYYPAYYEDTDLCLRIKATGEQIWYQPRSQLRHAESASTNAPFRDFLFARNKAIFCQKWAELLAEREAPRPFDPVATERAVHRAMGSPTRVLVIDDQVADPMIGSGYPRMYEVFEALQRPGEMQLSLFTSLVDGSTHTDAMCRLGVEMIDGYLEGHLAEDLRARAVPFDAAIISRPHNYERFAPVIREFSPATVIVYDAEALFARRLRRRAALATDSATREELERLATEMAVVEAAIAHDADALVAISEEEAAFFREHTNRPVTIHGPLLAGIELSPASFAERADIAFVAGWAAGGNSPNLDGLLWFAHEVLPVIAARVPSARLLVTGTGPAEAALRVAGPNIVFLGSVDDLGEFYSGIRVVVVPMRYGAGVKNKTIEALQYGVPTVATGVGAEGVPVDADDVLLVADDPRDFGRKVASLLEDRSAWEVQRRRIVAQHRRWYADDARALWPEILSGVLARGRQDARSA